MMHIPKVLIFMIFPLTLFWGTYISGQTPKAVFLSHTAKPMGFGYIAFGDLRGEIEPCGCNPETDLGGLRRIAQVIAQRRIDGDVYSLGNLYPKSSQPLKATLIERSLKNIKITAALVNTLELKHFYKTKKIPKGIPYLISNSRIFKKRSFIKTRSSHITGYVSPRGDKNLVSYKGLRKDWRKKLAKIKAQKILLFAGTDADLKLILKDQIFDEIISSNPKNMSATPDYEEKNNEGLLLRRGKVYTVPSFGQGVLLGGSLRQNLILPSFTQTQTTRMNRKPEFTFTQDNVFLWLTKEYEENAPLKKDFRWYNDAVAKKFMQESQAKQRQLKSTPYAGAEACKSCHAEAYEVWKNSTHAHAIRTLEEKGKHKDPDCVSCHVLAFDKKGGYINKDITPQFANVQCENCHGPRKAHSQNPTIKPANHDPRAVCTSCHHMPHSSNFQYDIYWPKIKHSLGK